MKGDGANWVISALIAIIILVLVVSMFWNIFNPNIGAEASVEVEEGSCLNGDDCIGNPDGSRCIILPEQSNEPFCGCLIASQDCQAGEDCISDRCK